MWNGLTSTDNLLTVNHMEITPTDRMSTNTGCEASAGKPNLQLNTYEVDHTVPILKFDLLGPVGEWLIRPTCISVSQTGEFAVTDVDSCFVIIYSHSGVYMSHFSTIPKRSFYVFIDIEKYKPQDVAWTSSKHVVYTQPEGCRFTVADWKGKSVVSIEGRPLYQPYGVCVDKSDNIYITDRIKGRVLCYNCDGKLIKSLGVFGSKDILKNPHYITITHTDDIYVNEVINGDVYVRIYTKTGTTNYILAKRGGGDTGCLAVDSEGCVLQVDLGCGHLVVCPNPNKSNGYLQNGKTTLSHNDKEITYPVCRTITTDLGGIAFTNNNQLVCIDSKQKQVRVYSWKEHMAKLKSL